MKKGIIMEIKRDILVMMTPEGEFLTGRKQPDQQYAIGEEIPFFPLRTESAKVKPIRKWNWKVSTSLLTALVVIIALFSSTVLQNNRAYAYVSVDINPSMELTLNNEKHVINIKPYNDDAKVLLKSLNDWENDEVSHVTERIFLLSEKLGYLKDNQNVLITSSFVDDSDPRSETDLLNELNQFVQKFSSEHHTNIIVKETTEKIREKASEKGMTAGSLIRETEEKKTNNAVQSMEKEDKEIKDEKANQGNKNQVEKAEDPSLKVTPPIEEKQQKSEKPGNQPNNRGKSQSQESTSKEKPVQSQKGHSSNQNNHSSHQYDRNEGKSNWGQNQSTHNEQNHKREDDDNNDHEDRKEEKKGDQHEKKEKKKD